MTIGPETSIRDLAFEICTAFERAGVTAVLSGGGAAAVYAPAAKQTDDLDFIIAFASTGIPATILTDLGFETTDNRAIYRHPLISFSVEFPPGPLAVGGEQIRTWNTLREGDRCLHMISPTDCVKDRLAGAIHWKDYSSITQAAEVARLHPVDMAMIEAWCAREGGMKEFARFRALLNV